VRLFLLLFFFQWTACADFNWNTGETVPHNKVGEINGQPATQVTVCSTCDPIVKIDGQSYFIRRDSSGVVYGVPISDVVRPTPTPTPR
jgi:hypothetical protein